MKRRKKTKSSDHSSEKLRGLFPPLLATVVAAAFCVFFICAPLSAGRAQNESTAPSAAGSQTSSSSSKHKHTYLDDFLIHGTVFNEKALALPGAKLAVRRESETKVHWQTVTNSRGDFALRVPHGTKYEVVVMAKGFTEQKRSVEAPAGAAEETIAFRLLPVSAQ